MLTHGDVYVKARYSPRSQPWGIFSLKIMYLLFLLRQISSLENLQ